MASGVIDGFFRKVRPGQPLRSLANIENLNKVANILNDITGEGCWIEKPLDGGPWIVHVSDDTSGEEPFMRRRTYDCQVDAVNDTTYRSDLDKVFPHAVSITVNGVAVAVDGTQPTTWAATAGVKSLYVLQRYSSYSLDTDNQYIGNPYYTYCTDTSGLGYDYALIAEIPWCRVEIPVVGEPPKIKNLLEGPLNLYAYRGDADTRAYAPSPANPQRQIQKSKTVDNSGSGSLPIKVRNLSAAADGYYNAYPEGRYKIEDGEVVWLEPHEPEQTKNDSKLLLLRYLWPQGGTPHGQPYWRTVAQFLNSAESWIEDYVSQKFGDDDKSWLISLLSPWAWVVWSENPGPYEPVLESDIEEGVEVVAAVMDKNGQWHSVFDIVITQDELDVTLDDYDDIADRVEAVESQAQSCVDDGEAASDDADAAEQKLAGYQDYSSDVSAVEAAASAAAGHAGRLLSAFNSLDARISALEQQMGGV